MVVGSLVFRGVKAKHTMLRRIMLLLSGVLLAAGSFAGGATQRIAAESINLHDLSLKVLVDGELIMTPNVQLIPTRTAYVSIGSPGEVVYTLTLDIIEHVAGAPAGATGLQMVLWRGGVGGGEMLLDSVMVMESRTIARAASEGRSPSVRIGGSTKASVEIELVSHAVLESDANVVATQATCTTARALSASSSDCCSAKCKDGSTNSVSCCGAYRCCGCGVYCSVP